MKDDSVTDISHAVNSDDHPSRREGVSRTHLYQRPKLYPAIRGL